MINSARYLLYCTLFILPTCGIHATFLLLLAFRSLSCWCPDLPEQSTVIEGGTSSASFYLSVPAGFRFLWLDASRDAAPMSKNLRPAAAFRTFVSSTAVF